MKDLNISCYAIVQVSPDSLNPIQVFGDFATKDTAQAEIVTLSLLMQPANYLWFILPSWGVSKWPIPVSGD
jgi:hypothetical protein